MDSISDPTDFSQTTIPPLSDLDTVVRCQVCKDFFNTPMITSCAHTFCSLCIRQCLSADGKCPTCRAGDQPSKLRRNGAVEEIVAAWTKVRGGVLEAVKKEEDSVEETARRKRKLVDEDEVMETPRKNRRQTRSLARKNSGIPAGSQIIDLEDDGEGGDGDYQPEIEGHSDGLVACPICNKRMKEAAVNAHLDSCMQITSPPTPIAYGSSRSQPSAKLPPSETSQYLGFLNYAMLKDLQLRKKLKDQGIPNDGSRQILEKRYTYWINLYNSNCDAKSPRSKRELLRELAVWEKSQFGNSAGSDKDAVMAKDFDGDGWKGRHKDQFQDLIAQARAKAKLAVRVADDGKADALGDKAEPKRYGGAVGGNHNTMGPQRDDPPPAPQSISSEAADEVRHIPVNDEREIPDSDDELYRDRTPPVEATIKTPSKQGVKMPVFQVSEDERT